MLNKGKSRCVFLFTSFLLITGCYNNSHIRTQRIIKEDEPVISGHIELNLGTPDYSEGAYSVRSSGISGQRVGISYLGLHRNYEQGINIGVGKIEGVLTDIILGYDIRKLRYTAVGKPYRLGLYLESNYSYGDLQYDLQGGLVYQVRPYIMSITTENHNWYGGFHGLMSSGTMTAFSDFEQYFDYDISSVGVGVTLGNEQRSGKFLLQTQLDVSFINQNHKVREETFQISEWDYLPQALNSNGLVVSVGVAMHRAPKMSAQKVNRRGVPVPKGRTAPDLSGRYDPFTGQFITSNEQMQQVTFDPLTGKIIQESIKPQFDPRTGQETAPAVSAEKQSPYSLLSPQEQSKLLLKTLTIRSLNGTPARATLLDVMDQGLLISRLVNGRLVQETIYYTRINRIKFEGARGGWTGGIQGALKGCGIGIGIPLLLSLASAEPEFMILSIVAVPPAALSGLLLGSITSDKYDLRILKMSGDQQDDEYGKQLILKLIKQYLNEGFPKKDINQQMGVAKP